MSRNCWKSDFSIMEKHPLFLCHADPMESRPDAELTNKRGCREGDKLCVESRLCLVLFPLLKLCPLTLFIYLSVMSLSPSCFLSVSLPFYLFTSLHWLAGVQRHLSLAEPNRGSQIHITPRAQSQARGE